VPGNFNSNEDNLTEELHDLDDDLEMQATLNLYFLMKLRHIDTYETKLNLFVYTKKISGQTAAVMMLMNLPYIL
jgi:hypothetical protein